MNHLQTALRLSQRSVTVVLLLAHVLAALALVAFGRRADGFALNGPASYGYLVLSGLAVVVFFLTIRRDDAWAEAGRIVLAPGLALVVAGVWFATSAFGAKYAPYGAWDDEGFFALLNAAFAGLGGGLALGLRWPRLLLTWAAAHGLSLLLTISLFGQLRYAGLVLNPIDFVPWLCVPVIYAAAGLALGWRPTRPPLRSFASLALVWLALAAAGVLSLRHQLLELGYWAIDLWPNVAAGVPAVAMFTVLILPLSWYAWRARSAWDPQALDRSPTGPTWIAFVGAALFGALLAGFLLSPERLPRAGDVQGWISSSHIVPADAWLPIWQWSARLFVAARWLLVPVVLLGLIARQPARRQLTVAPGTWLLWTAGVILVALSLESLTPIGLISGIVANDFRPPWYHWRLLSAFPYLLILGLLLAARLGERPLGPRARAGVALFIAALLGLFLWRHAAGAWTYARFLFFPLAPWARVAEYAPASPAVLAGLGLALHLLTVAFGVTAAWQWLRSVGTEWAPGPGFAQTLGRVGWASGAAVLSLTALWYGLTMPLPVRVVPAPGATGVPLDTLVLIEFPAPSELDSFLAGGFMSGLETRYAGTGEHIQGTTMGSASGLTFDPDALLRPGTVVEIIGRWGNKRPYVLRFTTASEAELSDTPLP